MIQAGVQLVEFALQGSALMLDGHCFPIQCDAGFWGHRISPVSQVSANLKHYLGVSSVPGFVAEVAQFA